MNRPRCSERSELLAADAARVRSGYLQGARRCPAVTDCRRPLSAVRAEPLRRAQVPDAVPEQCPGAAEWLETCRSKAVQLLVLKPLNG